MDENDKNLKELFGGLSDESVPFNFENKVQKKIDAKLVKRREIREFGLQISFAAVAALILSAALYYLNIKYFKIELDSFKYLLTDSLSFSGKVKSMFTNGSLLWVLIGLNVVLLIFAERIISEKLSQKEKSKGL